MSVSLLSKPICKFRLTISTGAAQRFPDKVDADPEAARSLNISATQSLAHATSSRSILLIYISTDYVFPGTAGDAPYESHASPAPPNLYGQTKLDGEKAVLAATKDSSLGVVLRVPVLYGPATKPAESAVNVLMDSLWKAQEPGAKIAMDDWSIRYPTCTEDVGRVCSDIAAMYLEAKAKSTAALTELPHILQFSSEDRVSKYEICEIFAEIMCLPMTGLVANKQGNDPNAKVQRPYDCHLSTNDLKTLGIDIRTVNFRDWW